MNKIKSTLTYLSLSIFFSLISYSCFASNQEYKTFLVNKAHSLNLANDKTWLSMLYYERKKLGTGFESIFDSQNFFLNKEGQTNPQKELESTIAEFFNKNSLPFKNIFNQKQTAQCAFKGRYEWLRKKLEFDNSKLPQHKCSDFEEWYKNINPQSATLIFASSYLNNPASMFGHTFLLINNDEEKQKILSQAVNYSANTDETNGIIFAYKGIFGLYDGKFSIMKYHKMIKKYNNAENRDIWEYDLNISQQELRMLMTNLWEINNNHANYYFFSENCSYLLLKLLQIVRSDIDYEKPIFGWIIPSDTVIKIAKTPKLIKKTTYRPSRVSNIKYLMDNADAKTKELACKIAKDKNFDEELDPDFLSLSDNQKKLTYDLSYEYLQYLYQKEAELQRSDMATLSLKILQRRSKIVGGTSLPEIKIPNSNPAFAHNTKKASVSYGYNRFRKGFTQLDFRPAYHDLLDADDGFLQGAQINILDLNLRYYDRIDALRINNFNIIDIKSYSARNLMFKPLSWELSIGANDFYINNKRYGTTALGHLAVGYNFDLPTSFASNISFFGSSDTYYNVKLPDALSSSIGPKVNVMTKISQSSKINISAKYNFFLSSDNLDYGEYKIEQSFMLNKNLSLKGYYEQKFYKNYRNEEEIGAGINYYF